MEVQRKDPYTEPVLATHDSLRDITGQKYREKTSDKLNDKAGAES